MGDISCCKKFLIYFFLGLNIFITIVILLLLFLATYDVNLLDWYQYIYLVLAMIVWLLLFVVYVGKLVLILIGQLNKLPTKYIKLAWLVLNGPAILFFIIGFIFDLVMYSQGEINMFLYIILYWIILVLYGVFTAFDFFHIDYQIQLSSNFSVETTQVKINNEDVKTYQEPDKAESVNQKMKST